MHGRTAGRSVCDAGHAISNRAAPGHNPSSSARLFLTVSRNAGFGLRAHDLGEIDRTSFLRGRRLAGRQGKGSNDNKHTHNSEPSIQFRKPITQTIRKKSDRARVEYLRPRARFSPHPLPPHPCRGGSWRRVARWQKAAGGEGEAPPAIGRRSLRAVVVVGTVGAGGHGGSTQKQEGGGGAAVVTPRRPWRSIRRRGPDQARGGPRGSSPPMPSGQCGRERPSRSQAATACRRQ